MAPRHLAARHGRALRRPQGGLPQGRCPHVQDTLGGVPKLPLHGALEGQGVALGPLWHESKRDSTAGP